MRSTTTIRGAGTLLMALIVTACTPEIPISERAPTQGTTAERQASSTPAPTASLAQYRDGQYTATGWYGSAPSHHDVTLTIDDNTITAVDITTPAENDTSLGYQQRFAAALPDVVIGRSIAELNIDRVAGSSGCSEGFMHALSQIRDQAALYLGARFRRV
ncbi:uncharacterized protein with FMN-binding domain [Arthrobacter sp. CAN_A6]|uniref:hypothetical protein n=1 Tax=Arthrobacter sp. CAN_A6 TaxID=2787721 RepID=UPI0018CAC8E3